MRVSKPIILYLPDSLVAELDNYLMENPPNFNFHRMYFYYVIHHLTVMQIQHKKEENFILNRTRLRSITVSNIDRYIKYLVNGDFIISDNCYQSGIKSLKYKLNEKYLIGIKEFELPHDSKLGKRILKNLHNRKAHYNRLESHLKDMKDELMKMEFDYHKAIKWVEINANDAQILSYLTSINHIEDKRFRYFNRNNTNGRLDTNLTNLKSGLRQYIIGDYVSIDLKNSQPFLLGVLLDNIIYNRNTLCCYLQEVELTKTFGIKAIREVLKTHQNQEKANLVNLRLFYDSVLEGTLYDEFIDLFLGDLSRNEAKEIMFKVLFSRNHFHSGYKKIIPYDKEKKVFASVYPTVYNSVKILKAKDHRNLPIYLQRLESYLFIDCIAKELVENEIVPFTIHDSVIVKSEHQEKTIEIMNKVFLKQIGVTPSFDIKNLNTINLKIAV